MVFVVALYLLWLYCSEHLCGLSEPIQKPFAGYFNKPVPERLNQSGFKWGKDDEVLGHGGIGWTIRKQSAPPSLPLDRQPHQHLIIPFLQAGCSSWRQTNSVKAQEEKCGTYTTRRRLVVPRSPIYIISYDNLTIILRYRQYQNGSVAEWLVSWT